MPDYVFASNPLLRDQRDSRFSRILKNFFHFHFSFSISSRFNFISTSRKRVKGFYFSLLEKSESYPYFTRCSREKRVKSSAGYNLTSIFVPNCISKDCQISSKHQPQNIGQISVLRSWPNPVLHVWTKLQLKKVPKNSALISCQTSASLPNCR